MRIARVQLAEGLAAVAGRWEPAEAAQLFSQALAQLKEDGPIRVRRGAGGSGRRGRGAGLARSNAIGPRRVGRA